MTKSAMEEQMFNGFFHMASTKQAVKVIANVIMPPLEHVSRVKAIREQEPTEDLDFRDAFGFPEQSVCIMGNHLSEEEGVVGCGFEISRSPRAYPGIIRVGHHCSVNILLESWQFVKSLNREGQVESLVKMGDPDKSLR